MLYNVVQWHFSGEVETFQISFAQFIQNFACQKIIKIGWCLTEIFTNESVDVFLKHGVQFDQLGLVHWAIFPYFLSLLLEWIIVCSILAQRRSYIVRLFSYDVCLFDVLCLWHECIVTNMFQLKSRGSQCNVADILTFSILRLTAKFDKVPLNGAQIRVGAYPIFFAELHLWNRRDRAQITIIPNNRKSYRASYWYKVDNLERP